MDNNRNTRSGGKEENSINLLDFFFYLLSYWYWFVLGVLVCAGIACYKYATSPFIYRSDATIIIKDPDNTRASTRMETYSSLINKTNLSNEILQFKSKRLMTEVVRRTDANVNYEFDVKLRNVELYDRTPLRIGFSEDLEDIPFNLTFRQIDSTKIEVTYAGNVSEIEIDDTLSIAGGKVWFVPTEYTCSLEFIELPIHVSKIDAARAAQRFLSQLKISQLNDDAAILTFSLQDKSVSRACNVLNTLFEVYNEDAIDDKNQIAINTARFIDERIDVIGKELGGVERELQEFKSRHNLVNTDDIASQYMAQTQENNSMIAAYDTQLKWAQYIRDYISNPANRRAMIPTSIGFDDQRVEGLIAQYNNLKMSRDQLVAESSEQNPVIVDMDDNMESLRNAIVMNLDNLMLSTNIKKRDVESQDSVALARMSRLPSSTRELLSIQRQQNIKETLYLYLLNKKEENSLSQAMVDDNAKVIDPAEGTSVHIAPDRNKMILLGILLGLAIPAIILIVRLALDNKVHSRKDLDGIVNIPIVGELPDANATGKSRKREKERLIFYECRSNGVMTSSLQILCTNMDFMSDNKTGCKVVTVSSFNASAGKSFVVANLSACMSDNRKRVVVIDLDMRKRSLSSKLGLIHKVSGASNFLSDPTVELDDIIHEDVIPGVDVIPAGKIPPNPVELLRRSRLDEMIASLRERYDFVLIDNVPVDVVADSVIIDRVVDMTLFVIRMGNVDRRVLSQLQKMYEEGKLHNMGLVLNGTDVRHRYGYSYGYGYGYSYGYGYGQGYGDKS